MGKQFTAIFLDRQILIGTSCISRRNWIHIIARIVKNQISIICKQICNSSCNSMQHFLSGTLAATNSINNNLRNVNIV